VVPAGVFFCSRRPGTPDSPSTVDGDSGYTCTADQHLHLLAGLTGAV